VFGLARFRISEVLLYYCILVVTPPHPPVVVSPLLGLISMS